MEKNILLVGCGNIGTRHLQALLKLQPNAIINVVEPNIKAQKSAKKLLGNKNIKTSINWFENISQINKKNDLVIVATNSKKRHNLISELLDQGHKRFLIEKIVCQSRTEYEKLISKMKKHNAKSWVNTPRRYFKSYQKIKNFFGNDISSININSGDLGLGSNAIHFLDLFCWFTNDSTLVLNGNYLDMKVLPNKRGKDFVEFSGTIIGKSKKNAFFSITFHYNQNLPSTVILSGKNTKLIIDETNSDIILNTSKEKFNFKMEFVSDITKYIVEDIFENDSCLLPKLEDSFTPHVELFRVFNTHLKKIHYSHSQLCPIT